MKQLLLLFSFIYTMNFSIAQSTNDTIHPVNLVRIAGIYHNDLVEKGDIKQIIIQNPNARRKVRTHNAFTIVSSFFLTAGIVSAFVPLYEVISRESLSPQPFVVMGGGLVFFTIFKTVGNNNFKTAVNIYNNQLSNPKASNQQNIPVELYSKGNNLGLRISF
jgi:hypothetical protein